MASNPVTCSNCNTENQPGEDFCLECGEPLTASADQELHESDEAQEQGGVTGGDAADSGSAADPLTSDLGQTVEQTRPHF